MKQLIEMDNPHFTFVHGGQHLDILDRVEAEVTRKVSAAQADDIGRRSFGVGLADRIKLGQVVLANARKSYKWGQSRPEWFGKRRTYGGTIGWVGIHALDAINYITGETFVSVAAMQSNLAHSERAECEDNCVLALELSNGSHATVSVELPDNLTTWRMGARGVTADTLVGQADVDIVSTKDLLIRPVAPRFFVVNDEVELAAVIHNNTEQPLEVEVVFEAEGLQIGEPALSADEGSDILAVRLRFWYHSDQEVVKSFQSASSFS